MYKTEFEFEGFSIKAECNDVDDYNVYGLTVSIVTEDDEEMELDIESNEEFKEMIHSHLLDVKLNKDVYDEVG